MTLEGIDATFRLTDFVQCPGLWDNKRKHFHFRFEAFPQRSESAFVRQFRRFEELLGAEGKTPFVGNIVPLPKAILAFAEELTDFHTEALAESHIEQNPEAAKGFLYKANEMVDAIEKGRVQLAPESKMLFSVLASAVIPLCRKAIEQHGDSWVHHSGSPKHKGNA